METLTAVKNDVKTAQASVKKTIGKTFKAVATGASIPVVAFVGAKKAIAEKLTTEPSNLETPTEEIPIVTNE